MRRPVAIATWLSLVALLVALLPSAVSAARAVKFHDLSTSVSCEIETDDGFVSMFAAASSLGGSFADLAFWAAPAVPFEDAPTFVATDATVTADATSMQATIQVAEYDETQDPPFGDALEPAILDATFTPIGDPIPIDDVFRDGNRWERVEGTSQPLAVEGSLTLPGADVTDLSGCGASFDDIHVFATNPAARNFRFDEFGVQCAWELEPGIVEMFVSGDAFGAFAEVFVGTDDRSIGGGAEATLTTESLAFDAVLFDFEDDSEVGSATAAATLTAGAEAIRVVDQDGRNRLKVVATTFAVDGTLELTIDGQSMSLPIDDTQCLAQQRDVQGHTVSPGGPPARPYVNDGPDEAIALRLGRTVRLTTGAGAEAPEAPCVTDDGFELPLAHTAWWSIVGTGGELTADSGASDFDTIIGVYVRDGADLVQVACVDDVFDDVLGGSLQSVVTWASEAGVTYLIQAGGFGGSTGHLALVVR